MRKRHYKQLYNAIREKRTATIEYLTDRYGVKQVNNSTALFYAVKAKNLEAIRFWLDRGGSPNHDMFNHAIEANRPDILKLLINVEDPPNYWSIYEAIKLNRFKVLKFLLEETHLTETRKREIWPRLIKESIKYNPGFIRYLNAIFG